MSFSLCGLGVMHGCRSRRSSFTGRRDPDSLATPSRWEDLNPRSPESKSGGVAKLPYTQLPHAANSQCVACPSGSGDQPGLERSGDAAKRDCWKAEGGEHDSQARGPAHLSRVARHLGGSPSIAENGGVEPLRPEPPPVFETGASPPRLHLPESGSVESNQPASRLSAGCTYQRATSRCVVSTGIEPVPAGFQAAVLPVRPRDRSGCARRSRTGTVETSRLQRGSFANRRGTQSLSVDSNHRISPL